MKLYAELAHWWPLLSAPADYEEEAAVFAALLKEGCARRPASVLELGSGGGNNALHMKGHFSMTLVDVAPAMVAVARALNPDCEHLVGDMRSVRLGRTFDGVFIHDAVCYMVSRDDLRAAMETAFVHCAPGGCVVVAPDFVRETFEAGTEVGGHDGPSRGLRYLSWHWDPAPADDSYVVHYAYMLREADGSVKVEHDLHVEGVFSTAVWLEVLEDVGFLAEARPIRHSEVDREGVVFLGRRPE